MEQNRKFSKSDFETVKWMWHTFHKERWHVFILIFSNAINAILSIVFADFSKTLLMQLQKNIR